MARVKKEPDEPIHIGRVIAVLRESLDWTQSDLSRESGVKRGAISLYEAGKMTPDVVTLGRLLRAMRFRWIALDFGRWFVDWLLTHCRIPDGQDTDETGPSPMTLSALATQLSADVAATNQTAVLLSKLVVILQEEQRKEPASESADSDAPARDRKAERRAAQALWTRIKLLPRKEQEEALRGAPPEAQWAVCDLLCLESQRQCGEDPMKAIPLCELALVAADL